MTVRHSRFARNLEVETAFSVLARARELQAQGKDVIELEIGDSPFPSTSSALEAGRDAIADGHTRYCASAGLPELREAAADYVCGEYGVDVGPENVVVGPGAKIFETLFCQAFLDPGDRVLVFSPHFPTYVPNIESRGARVDFATLLQENDFRPQLADVEAFLEKERARAIFLNSPHNPTGGVATEEDLGAIADAIRGRDVAVFSDEPYDRMAWSGSHHTLLSQEGMAEQCVAAYTFSKSYSMSGWRLGFAVSSAENAEVLANLVNISLSCVPPLVQLAGAAALRGDAIERDRSMEHFRRKVELMARGLDELDGVRCLVPDGAFYVFPNVEPICERLGITSHGLAMYLLEGADDELGVACLGGECFGASGSGFLRFSCAEEDERLRQALEFLPRAWSRVDRVASFKRRAW